MESNSYSRRSYLLALAVSLLTFIVYLPALRNEFILWDDDRYLTGNLHIRQFDWSMVRWAFSEPFLGQWHPLTSISQALDVAVWGMNPAGHHLTNIVLHAGSTFLVVFICIRLVGNLSGVALPAIDGAFADNAATLVFAGVTATLFGLHPLHVESVAWASERKDLLYGFFYLASVYCYLIHLAGGGADRFAGRSYLLSLIFFVLSLLCKSMAVTLPVVMLILEWRPLGLIRSVDNLRRSLIEKIPFFVFGAITAVVAIMAMSSEQETENLPMRLRPLVAARSILAYLWNMVFPVNLLPYYPYPHLREITLASPSYLLPIVLVTLVSGYAICSLITSIKRNGWRLEKSAGTAGSGMVWQSSWFIYILMIFPVIGIFENGTHVMADRNFYLPSLGPFCLIGVVAALGWKRFRDKPLQRGLSLVVVSLLAVAMIWVTSRQIRIWKNSIVFWSYVIYGSRAPIPIAYNNRALAYKQMGEFEKALADLNYLVELYPNSTRALVNRGGVLIDIGDFNGAIADSSRAIALEPTDSGAYLNLGLALKKKGELDKAMESFNRAIELDPANGSAYNNRGLARKSAGEYAQALQDYSRAIELMPDDADAWNNRGVAFELAGRPDDAIRDYDRAVALNPGHVSAYNNRGLALGRKGMQKESLADFDTAVSLAPTIYLSRLNRAMTLMNLGEYERAITDYTAVLALEPDLAVAYLGRGVAYEKLDRAQFARGDYEKACSRGSREGCDLLLRRKH